MRMDLTAWDQIQAKALLSAVREQGTLAKGAAALGLPYRTARTYWRKWKLQEDLRIHSGRRRKPGGRAERHAALEATRAAARAQGRAEAGG